MIAGSRPWICRNRCTRCAATSGLTSRSARAGSEVKRPFSASQRGRRVRGEARLTLQSWEPPRGDMGHVWAVRHCAARRRAVPARGSWAL